MTGAMTTISPIPLPSTIEFHGGPSFALDAATVIDGAAFPQAAARVAQVVSDVTGIALPLAPSEISAPGSHAIHLRRESGGDLPEGDEAYRLDSRHDGITLSARTTQGLLLAASTLGQIIAVQGVEAATVPALTITDAPRFEWRGFSVDVARSFLPVDELEAVIDLLARYRFNKLHLHLTDDQGWRLEIPERPELTDVSGRTASTGGRAGYYTVEDYDRIQNYAEARGIVVIPEIDMPGHTNAATHVYGNLTPGGEPTAAYDGMVVGFSKLDPSLAATEPFVRDVLSSLATRTRGEYLHIGGDECLSMDAPDYAALVSLAATVVREQGKNIVGWQEVAAVPLPQGVIVQYWDPALSTVSISDAVEAGARVVTSPANRAYLDMKHDADDPIGQDWAGYVELEASYRWDPADEVSDIPASAIVGVEGAVWTETIHSFDGLTSMLLPRLAAVAEVAWTNPQTRRWESFASRIARESTWWTKRGWTWHRSPGVNWDEQVESGK